MVLLPIVYGPEESHGGDIVAFITDELAGYKDYAQGVRYRLPPGIW